MRQPLFCMHSCMGRSSQTAVRKTMPHGPVRCMDILHSGPPATAVRFGNRLAPSVGRHLTGQKGLGTAPTHKAAGRERFIAWLRL